MGNCGYYEQIFYENEKGEREIISAKIEEVKNLADKLQSKTRDLLKEYTGETTQDETWEYLRQCLNWIHDFKPKYISNY